MSYARLRIALAFIAATLPAESFAEALYRDASLEISGSGLRKARSCEVALLPTKTSGKRPPKLTISLKAARIDEIAVDVADRSLFDEVLLVQDNQRRPMIPVEAGGASEFSGSAIAAALRSGEVFFLTARLAGGDEYQSGRYEGIDFDRVLALIGEACPFDAEAFMSDTKERQRVEAGLGLNADQMRQIRRALNGTTGSQPSGSLHGAERDKLRQFTIDNGFPISRYLTSAVVDDLLKKAPVEPPPPPPLPTKLFQRYDGIDFEGADLGPFLPDRTFASCTDACAARPNCRALTFNQKRGSCFLKSGPGTPTYNELAISAAVEGTFVPSPNMRIDDDWDYPGGDFDDEGLRPVSFADCKAMCTRDSRCQAFSFVKNKEWCWLKYYAGSGESKSGIISGLKLPGG